MESQMPKYEYISGGQKQVTKNPATADRYDTQHRFHNINKLNGTVATLTGQKKKFRKLCLKAISNNSKTQEQVAQELNKLFENYLVDVMEENFEEYIKFFKQQTLKEKQSIVYEQLQMLAGLTNNMCKELKIPNEIIVNKELVDLKNENYTEDDFAEALIVLINSIQNSICDYSNGITKLFSKIDN